MFNKFLEISRRYFVADSYALKIKKIFKAELQIPNLN